jgi:hypothetical protein
MEFFINSLVIKSEKACSGSVKNHARHANQGLVRALMGAGMIGSFP